MRSCHSGDSLTSRHQSTAPLSTETEADDAAAPAASTASNPLIGNQPANARAGKGGTRPGGGDGRRIRAAPRRGVGAGRGAAPGEGWNGVEED